MEAEVNHLKAENVKLKEWLGEMAEILACAKREILENKAVACAAMANGHSIMGGLKGVSSRERTIAKEQHKKYSELCQEALDEVEEKFGGAPTLQEVDDV